MYNSPTRWNQLCYQVTDSPQGHLRIILTTQWLKPSKLMPEARPPSTDGLGRGSLGKMTRARTLPYHHRRMRNSLVLLDASLERWSQAYPAFKHSRDNNQRFETGLSQASHCPTNDGLFPLTDVESIIHAEILRLRWYHHRE